MKPLFLMYRYRAGHLCGSCPGSACYPAAAERSIQHPRGKIARYGGTCHDNVHKLFDAKAALMRKASGADQLDIEIAEDTVSFPWWDTLPEETQ